MSDLGFQTKLNETYEAAIEKVTAALKVEGFGVLTSIDMKDTMKKKLGVDFRKYAILGACNPTLANRALTACAEVGLLLPCNVIVYEEGEGTIVNIVDPSAMLELIKDDPEVEAVAREAGERLARVAASLKSQ
jgi:uncharacterized protein (DUF302 family)